MTGQAGLPADRTFAAVAFTWEAAAPHGRRLLAALNRRVAALRGYGVDVTVVCPDADGRGLGRPGSGRDARGCSPGRWRRPDAAGAAGRTDTPARPPAGAARAAFAREEGDDAGARHWAAVATRLKRAFNRAFWLPARGWYAAALDRDKGPSTRLPPASATACGPVSPMRTRPPRSRPV